jgi:hypothetical protein
VYRGINDFKNGYQPQNNIVKNDGYLVTDSQGILSGLRNNFSWQLNVRVVGDVRQTEIRTAESFEPESSSFEDEVAIEKLKREQQQKFKI